MSSLPFLLVLCFILLLFNALMVNKIQRATERINQYLSERGATDIDIRYTPFDFDRSNLTFSITYTGISGKQQMAQCKLNSSLFIEEEDFFWTSLPDLNLHADEIINEPTPVSRPRNTLSEKISSKSTDELPTFEIVKTLSIPGSHDQIVMLNYTQSFQNVLRCKMNGETIWQAELPTAAGDVYTNVQWEGQQLTAFSRSCLMVVLDVETGKIIPEQ